MPPILHLWLFGPFQAEIDHGLGPCPLPPLPTRPARALLARLSVAHPAPILRSQLVEDLFSAVPADRANHHLRTTLYYLRRVVPDLVVSNAAHVGLHPELALDLDVTRFEEASRPGATRVDLEEAIGLYRGRFLETPLDGWAEEEARRLHNRYLDTLQRMVALSQAGGHPGDGLEAARRWAAEEPWEIKAHRALIAAYIDVEDYRAAEAQVARARQILNGEWGQETDETFETLARQSKVLATRAASTPPQGTVETQKLILSGSPLRSKARQTGPPQIDFEQLPMVGRLAEFNELWEGWMRARQGKTSVIVLEGPAGMGKTRLAGELAARARLQVGTLVLWGEAEETTAHTPLGLLRNVFARLNEPEMDRMRHLCAGLNPVIRSLLGRFIPELRPALGESVPLSPVSGAAEQARRQTALSALAQVLPSHGPVLLVLENSHRSDAETLEFVQEAITCSGQEPRCLAVILTCRSAESVPDPAWPVIRLAPLRGEEIGLLINQALMVSKAGPLDRQVVEKLTARSGGNPLFAREILRGLAEQGRLSWDHQHGWQLLQTHIPLPNPVTHLLAQRLDALSDPARMLATLLAVLGRPAGDTLLARLFQIVTQDLPLIELTPEQNSDDGRWAISSGEAARFAVQAELLERHVLVEQGERLWFDHDWLCESLLASLDAPSRAAFHEQVAQTLEDSSGLDLAERMQHYLQASRWEPAFEDALAVAETALEGQNLSQMGHALRAAESTLTHLDLPALDPRRWDYLRLMERYQSQVDRGTTWQQALDHLVALAQASGQDAWLVEALTRKANGWVAAGQIDQAIWACQKAAETARAAQLPAREAEALELLVSIMMDWAKLDSAGPVCEALLSAAQASSDERLQCLALNQLVQFHMLTGNVTEAIRLFTRLAAHPYIQKGSDWDMLRQMAIFSMAGRAYEPGLAWLRASAHQAQRVGDVLGIVRSQAYLCFELANLGRYAEVIAVAEGVLPLACQLKEAYQEGFLYYSMAKAVWFDQEDPQQALALVEKGIQRTEAFRLNDPLNGLLGLEARICLGQGWLARARSAVERAAALAPPSGVVMIDHIAAQVWLAVGQPEKARCAAHLAIERAHDQGFLAVWASEMLWDAAHVLEQVDQGSRSWTRAVCIRAYARFVDDLTRLETPAARRLFIKSNPSHRALAGYSGDGSCRILWLPETNAPTGRPLREDELAPVVWYRDEPGEPDLATPAGRRVRLQRLAQAALDQGAVATLEALADFLAASPRTVQRDLRALRETGVTVPTRGVTKA